MAEPVTERRPHPARQPKNRTEEIDSTLLLGSERRIRIRHRGQTYELRETRFGKLILTK